MTTISVEERRVLSKGRARVVVINVNNSTPVAFAAISGQCRTLAGKFRASPPSQIAPYSQIQLLTESEAFLGGNKASLTYEALTKRKEKVYLEWSFSFFGEKAKSYNVAAPLRVMAQQHAEGSLFEVTFTISSEEPLVPLSSGSSASTSSLPVVVQPVPVTPSPGLPPAILVTTPSAAAAAAAAASEERRSVLTIATYTHAGERCDDALCRRFTAYDVVCIQGIPTQEMLDELHDRFRLTHSYIAIMGRAHAPGCGMLFASKLGIIKALPCQLTGVLGIGGTFPSGGILACKLDVGPVFPGCFFWVFQMQHDDPKPVEYEPAITVTVERKEALKTRKLLMLRDFVSETLQKEDSPGRVGVVLTGDIGIEDFAEVSRVGDDLAASMLASMAPTAGKGKEPALSAVAEDILPAIALDLNVNGRIVFCSQLPVMLKARGLSVALLGQLRAATTAPRMRSLLLAEMVARAAKNSIVKKLSREWDGSAQSSLAKYRTLVTDLLCLFNSSWNAQGPVFTAHADFWQNEIKGKIEGRFPNGLNERERGLTYDLRTQIVPFQLIRAAARALHVRLSATGLTRITKYPGGHVLPADIEEIALPGLFVFPEAPRRKLRSQHLAALCTLDARDIHNYALTNTPGDRVLKVGPTQTRLLSIDRIPVKDAAPLAVTNGPQLAVISCIDGDAPRITDNAPPVLAITISVSSVSQE